LNIITPYFSQKRKNLTQLPAEKRMLTILWDYRGNLPGVHHQGYKNQLQDLSEDPREAENMNQSH